MEEDKAQNAEDLDRPQESDIEKIEPRRDSYLYTDLGDSPIIMKLQDDKVVIKYINFAMHCQMIQLLIFGKIVSIFVFIIGLADARLLALVPALFLELLGYFGSSNLKPKINYLFLAYLVISIVFRFISAIITYLSIDDSGLCTLPLFTIGTSGNEFYCEYLFGSILLIFYETLQVYLSFALVARLHFTSEAKIEEFKTLLYSQRIPKFICLGKLNINY